MPGRPKREVGLEKARKSLDHKGCLRFNKGRTFFLTLTMALLFLVLLLQAVRLDQRGKVFRHTAEAALLGNTANLPAAV